MPPRVLILSPAPTHPQATGTSARILQLAAMFQRLGAEVHFLYCPAAPFGCKPVSPEMQAYWGDRGHYLPTPAYWGTPVRVNHLRWLYKAASLLFGHPPRGGVGTPWGRWMDRVYHHPDFWCPVGLAKQVRRICRGHGIGLCVCEYFLYSAVCSELGPDVTTVIDTIDVFSGRNQRVEEVVKTGGRWLSLEPEKEKAALLRADRVIAIQEEEREMFTRMLEGNRPVATFDFVDTPGEVEVQAREGKTVGLVAADNPVNRHGFDWFYREVWPTLLERVPEARLRVAGGLSGQLDYPDVESVGYVDDLDLFLSECTVMINPVLAGTGLKIKSLDALRVGQALVSTVHGADGIRTLPGSPVVATDDAAEFAAACIHLLEDPEFLEEVRANTKAFYRNRHLECMREAECLLKEVSDAGS